MGASREARESEKIFTSIWTILPHLINCLWYPLPEDAREYIREIRVLLDKLEHQLNREEQTKISSPFENKVKLKITCLSIDCPERKSVCCGAISKNVIADEGTGYFACSKCGKEFIGGKCRQLEAE